MPIITRHVNRRRVEESERQRIERASRQPGGFAWPELRIGRNFDLAQSREWDDFLNALESYKGRGTINSNERKGHARVAGAIACHYVTDAQMRMMIRSKYDLASPEKAEIVYGKIRDRLNGFILQEQNFYSPRYNGKKVASALFRQTENPQEFYDSPHFAPAQLEVGELYGYGVRKWGVSLKRNKFLFDERAALLQYLSKEEGLNVSPISGGWEPHATIFELHQHLRINEVAPIVPRSNRIPTILPMLRVSAN